jgi:uncharacterized coiled-coil protein SlyX
MEKRIEILENELALKNTVIQQLNAQIQVNNAELTSLSESVNALLVANVKARAQIILMQNQIDVLQPKSSASNEAQTIPSAATSDVSQSDS